MRTALEVPTPWECKKSMISRTIFCSAQAAVMRCGAKRADAFDLAQSFRCRFDDFEDLLTESLDEAFGVNGADPPDHARGEVFLDALDGGGRRRLEKFRPELEAMRPVVVPGPARGQPFARRDRCRMANRRDHVPVAAGLDPQDAKAVLLIVEGHPFNEASKNFGGIVVRLHRGGEDS